jgi:DNA topoisomerase-1
MDMQLENGHLQATGLDAKKENNIVIILYGITRNQTKFYRMLQFGRVLPAIRKQVQKDCRGRFQ